MSPVSASPTPLVCITGASSGIGQALALAYAQAGWRLALVVRKEKETKSWLDAHQISQDSYEIYTADVADVDATVAAGEAICRRQGLPDVVVANAGISIGMDTRHRRDLDVMTRTLMTNNVGMAATFHPFVAAMVARGTGTLVGVASVAAIRGMPGHGAYCASKAAVVSYCESLRAELHGTGVRVVTLLPGYVDTPLTRHNPYPMPFLMAPEAFAQRALRAIARGDAYRIIPWPMAVVAAVLRVWPRAGFDRFFSRRPRKPRQTD